MGRDLSAVGPINGRERIAIATVEYAPGHVKDAVRATLRPPRRRCRGLPAGPGPSPGGRDRAPRPTTGAVCRPLGPLLVPAASAGDLGPLAAADARTEQSPL